MGFNSAFKGLNYNTNASRWQMGFNSAFKGLNYNTNAVMKKKYGIK
jgi:hypothetical protein